MDRRCRLQDGKSWGRDHFAIKDVVRDILINIKDMRADIKSELPAIRGGGLKREMGSKPRVPVKQRSEI
jgi:hypothetical protein